MDKTTKLCDKLIQLQTSLDAKKDKKNSFGKYAYRNLEGILDALKPLLSLTQTSVTMSDTIENVGGRNYVKATVCLGDGSDSICTTAFAWEEMRKGMDASQCTGSASSYARKYAMNGLFAISENSPDADSLDNTKLSYTPKADIEKAIKMLDKAFEDGNTALAKRIFDKAESNNPPINQVIDRYIMLFGIDDDEGM
jgi:hypothetical protein